MLRRSVLALFAAPLVGSMQPAMADSGPAEMRGLWVVRTALVSPQAVDRVVDDASEAGFNALFVQVRGRGDAFYRSALVPRSPLLERQPRDFDPFARLLARARSRGLRVHAWVNVLLAAHFGQPLPQGHVLVVHPDWAMVPQSIAATVLKGSATERLRRVRKAGRADGDVEGYYLAPSRPGVGDHLEEVVRELVGQYAIDGLHLDFIRYPGPSFDYSRAALEAFRRRTGETALLSGPRRQPEAWNDFRREVLTALAARLAEAARTERPGTLVSAAVIPDEALAVQHRFQDWPVWLKTGVLSAVCPMAYTTDNALFGQLLEGARDAAGKKPVWAGIGAFRLDPAGLVEKIALARQAGASGVLLFSHESLGRAHRRRLCEEAFAVRTARVDAGPCHVPAAR